MNKSFPLNRWLGVLAALWIISGSLCLANPGDWFSSPQPLTDGTLNYRLSRTANKLLTIDASGTVHLSYWAGDLETSPTNPSAVFYRTWTRLAGWSSQTAVDNSEVSGQPIGGRHPSLAVRTDGAVWVVWNDHRNCNEAENNNWVDNIEIYGDRRSPGSSFSSTDYRLTNSNAPHSGDNAYTPKIAIGPDGRFHFCWFDFNGDFDFSDIYIKSSDLQGDFDTAEPMSSMRKTVLSERGSGPSYTVPDLTVTPDGTIHCVWLGGFGPDGNLYYGTMLPDASRLTETLLASGAADFYDPPHITSTADGTVWVASADDSQSPERVALWRRADGAAGFDSPRYPVSVTTRQTHADMAVGPQGWIHLVWVDYRSGRHIYYGIYDPQTESLLEESPLTAVSGDWTRPSIALGENGEVFVVWEEDRTSWDFDEGDIWFSTNMEFLPSQVSHWEQYQ